MGYMTSYQGDYMRSYAGDPGLFGFIGKSLGGLAKLGGRIFARTPIGSTVGAVIGAAAGRRTLPPGPPGLVRMPAFGPTRQQVPRPGVIPGLQRLVPGGQTGMMDVPRGFHLAKDGSGRMVRNRTMNVANPKALRRAIRRQEGFVKLAKRSLPPGYRITTSARRSAPKKPC